MLQYICHAGPAVALVLSAGELEEQRAAVCPQDSDVFQINKWSIRLLMNAQQATNVKTDVTLESLHCYYDNDTSHKTGVT